MTAFHLDEGETTMRMKPILLTTLGCLLLSMTTLAGAFEIREHSITVGQQGEITLTQPTKVGDIVLQPDTYIVQHRVSGANHFIRFIQLKQVRLSNGRRDISYTEKSNAGEIKCLMEPLGAPAKQTSVSILAEAGGDRITQVTIKGEDVMHDLGRVAK
jgi:hypothetical protein